MKIFVLGGDGFCGWPTSLHLAASGHEVVVVDNLSRRRIDTELNSNSLTNIRPYFKRLDVASKLVGNIRGEYLDVVVNYLDLLNLIRQQKPDAIIHFAEQRAAPYSMISDEERRYTIENNISVT